MELHLADGMYPFIYDQFPLSEMAMVEAPAALEALFKSEAQRTGVVLGRDSIVELTCKMPDNEPDARFMIYWPSGQDRIHVLTPKVHAKGRA